jgi:predicted glycoside hydrolase/deacetylase ChbG (UPF0249 family)
MAADIKLIVRADDMGMTHGCNRAVQECFTSGILTCAAIEAPAPWASEAAAMCKANPDWCIGAHLTPIGEWVGYRWRPVLSPEKVLSLVDAQGFLRQTPKDFYSRKIDYDQLEQEFTAQVRLIQETWGVRLCYVDDHYLDGSNPPDPPYAEVMRSVGRRFSVPLSSKAAEKMVQGVYSVEPALKEETLIKRLRDLTPGLWLVVDHLLDESEESNALRHADSEGFEGKCTGAYRAAEARMLRSDRVKAVIKEKGIRLVSYRDLG